MTHIRARLGARRLAEAGFMLLELLIALTITGVVVIYGFRYWNHEMRMEQARTVGKQFQIVNNAVGNYLAIYYQQLQAINGDCKLVAFAVGAPTGAPLPASCAMTVTPKGADGKPNGAAYSVPNALQPTVTDLIGIGLLPVGFLDRPGFYARSTVVGSGGVEPYRYGIQIWHACAQPSPVAPSNVAADTLDCAQADKDLSTLVFNTQPFFPNDTAQDQVAMLGEAMATAGGDAAMSTRLSNGELQGARGAFVIANPIRTSGGSGVGATSILAMRGGYGAAGWMQFTRRDGSAAPTNDWDFNGKSISNVQRLDAAEAGFTSKLKIPTKTIGASCDTATESIAFIADGFFASCGAGKWQYTQTKGSPNPQVYQDVLVGFGGSTVVTPINLDPAKWGMPSVVGLQGNDQGITDTWCGKSTGWFTGAGVGLGVVVVGGYAEVYCSANYQQYSVTPGLNYQLAATSTNWTVTTRSTTSGTLTVRFYALN